MTTGQRIKAARQRAGLTQTELAEKLGIPFQSISQWERDTRNPKQETLLKIAKALGVHLRDLVDDSWLEELDPQIETDILAELAPEYLGLSDDLLPPSEDLGLFDDDEYENLFSKPQNGDLGLLCTDEIVKTKDKPKERIAAALNRLNLFGQKKVAIYAEDLAEISKYQTEDVSQPTSTPQEGTGTLPKETS